MKILILTFHPNLKESRVNKIWYEQFKAKFNTVIDEYSLYPEFNIDVSREQELLLNHDRVVLQFPFYWYSVTPLLKKWLDDVLEYGFAYGSGGEKLKGKEMQIVVSVGGPESSYMPGGYNNFSPTEFFRPLEQTANLIKMKYLPPLWMHDSVKNEDEVIKEYGNMFVKAIMDENRGDPWALQRKAIKEAVKLT